METYIIGKTLNSLNTGSSAKVRNQRFLTSNIHK